MIRSALLGAFAALALTAGSAAAAKLTWSFDTPVVTGAADGAFVVNATMTNIGDQPITWVSGAGYEIMPTYVTGHGYGPTPDDIWSLYSQFTTLNLAPNESFGFAFANVTYAGAPDGSHVIIPMGYLLVDGEYFTASNTVSLKVGDAATGAVPEPAAWALMIVGFGGVGGMLRLRRTLPRAA